QQHLQSTLGHSPNTLGASRLPFGGEPSPDPSPLPSVGDGSRTSSLYDGTHRVDLDDDDEEYDNVGAVIDADAPRQSHTYAHNRQLSAPQVVGEAERPVSTGQVGRHIAGESIHPGVWADDRNKYLGHSAELVGDRGRRSSRGEHFGEDSGAGANWPL
ncbi:hypothetical protein LTS18_012870, partial [Coniosporium uncinatum]